MTEGQIRALPLDRLTLSNRVLRCLRNNGLAGGLRVKTVGDLMDVVDTPGLLAKMPNFGRRSMNEVSDELHRVGVAVTGDPLGDGRAAIARERRMLKRGHKEKGATVWLLEGEMKHIRQMLPHHVQEEHSVHEKLAHALQRLI